MWAAAGGMARTAHGQHEEKKRKKKLAKSAKKLLRRRAREVGLAGGGGLPAPLDQVTPPPMDVDHAAEPLDPVTAGIIDELLDVLPLLPPSNPHGSESVSSDGEWHEGAADASLDGAGAGTVVLQPGDAADGPPGPPAKPPPSPASSAAGHAPSTTATTCAATPTPAHVPGPATAGAPILGVPKIDPAVACALRRVQQHPPAVMARRECRRPGLGCGRMTGARCSVRNKPACFFRREQGTEHYMDCFLVGLVPPDVLPWFAKHRPVPHSKVTHAGTPYCETCHRVASTRCASCDVPLCYYPRVKQAHRRGGALGSAVTGAPFRDCWLTWHLGGVTGGANAAPSPPPPPPPRRT